MCKKHQIEYYWLVFHSNDFWTAILSWLIWGLTTQMSVLNILLNHSKYDSKKLIFLSNRLQNTVLVCTLSQ